MKLNTWIILGTPLAEAYPCRCHERPDWAVGKPDWHCDEAWCPCSGRTDPQGPGCCGNWRTTAMQQAAMAEWRVRKIERDRLEREAGNG